jgi:hypothetical protein
MAVSGNHLSAVAKTERGHAATDLQVVLREEVVEFLRLLPYLQLRMALAPGLPLSQYPS